MSLSSKLMKKTSYVLKGESSWSRDKVYYFYPSFILLQKLSYSSNPAVITEIQELVQKLKLDNIRRVRAIAPNASNIHIIDFELALQSATELSSEAWNKIQDLVIDYEWKLRDETNEKWYFRAEVVELFSKLKIGAEVVAEYPIQRVESLITNFSVTKIQTKHYSSV